MGQGNPLRGEVVVQALDATYTLRLTNTALIRLQEAWGFDPSDPARTAAFFGRLSVIIRAYLPMPWRQFVLEALRDRHPDATEDLADKLIDAVGWEAMGESMAAALAHVLVAEEDDAGPKDQAPTPESPSPGVAS